MRRTRLTKLAALVLAPCCWAGCTTPDDEPAVYVYANTIEALEPMSEARFSHTATALMDGRVLVIGGILGSPAVLDADAYVAEVDILDPDTLRFERGAALALPRSQHSATLLADGRVVVLGGNAINEQGLSGPALAVELWDPADQVFTTVAELDTRLLFHCAVPIGNRDNTVLAIDECTPEGCVARRVDVDAGTVTPLDGLPIHRYGLDVDCALLPDGRVLLAGGADLGPNGELLPVSELEIYDPVAQTFEVAGPISNMFGEQSELAALGDGRFLLMGGAEGLPIGQIFTAEDQGFMPVGGDVVDRREHTLVTLADGRVLIVGGQLMDSPGFEFVSELDAYDPATGSFTSVGASIPGRSGHATARLADGTVLIVGGQADSGPLADAFLFR